jgi:hypothetical protein
MRVTAAETVSEWRRPRPKEEEERARVNLLERLETRTCMIENLRQYVVFFAWMLATAALGAAAGCRDSDPTPTAVARVDSPLIGDAACVPILDASCSRSLLYARVASRSSGTFDAVAVAVAVGGGASQLYHRAWNGTAWVPQSGWESISPRTVRETAPAIVADGPNALDVFATDGTSVYHYTYSTVSGGAWSEEQLPALPNGIAGSPAAVSWSSARIDVFAVGTDGNLYHLSWSAGTWSPQWEEMTAQIIGSPAVASWGPNRLDVFVIGSVDGALYHKAWTGSAWSPASVGIWDRLDGTFTGNPAAVSSQSGSVDAFAVRQSDSTLFHWSYDGTTFAPAGGERVGGSIHGSPAVSSWGPGRVDVVVTGAADPAAYHKALNGGTWSPADPSTWDRLGGRVSGDPTAVSWGVQRYDVLVTGSDDGAIYHKDWSQATGWQPCMNCDAWEDLGRVP